MIVLLILGIFFSIIIGSFLILFSGFLISGKFITDDKEQNKLSWLIACLVSMGLIFLYLSYTLIQII